MLGVNMTIISFMTLRGFYKMIYLRYVRRQNVKAMKKHALLMMKRFGKFSRPPTLRLVLFKCPSPYEQANEANVNQIVFIGDEAGQNANNFRELDEAMQAVGGQPELNGKVQKYRA